jgi:hypothetical protein
MKIFGISLTRQLIELPLTEDGDPNWLAATPEGRYTLTDPRAPWNVPDPGPVPADPANPDAPEQPQPEPINRNPDAYPGVLWTPPDVIPFVKLPAPHAPAGQVADPLLVWHADRVERDWSLREMTPDELAAAARKIWPDTAHFWDEFTTGEAESIAMSAHPAVRRLSMTLATWRAVLHSDDPRVSGGLQLLESVGILTPARRAAILAP